MPSIRIEAGAWLLGREREMMLAVNAATFEPLGVGSEQNDIVINCRDESTRLIAPGKSERFCRIEIKMLVGRSDDQKRQLRSNICRSLQPFGIADNEVKMIITDVPKSNLGR
ncbi:tautomerase family protein [Boseaceae bacterium BT-24-1]|nr:tautomerase family protein [Boseaceae bacterium BT-24-1]